MTTNVYKEKVRLNKITLCCFSTLLVLADRYLLITGHFCYTPLCD